MNYKKLQIVPIKRRYLRISETENPIPITVFTVKSSFSSLFMDLRVLVNSRHLVGKKGSVETVMNGNGSHLNHENCEGTTGISEHLLGSQRREFSDN